MSETLELSQSSVPLTISIDTCKCCLGVWAVWLHWWMWRIWTGKSTLIFSYTCYLANYSRNFETIQTSLESCSIATWLRRLLASVKMASVQTVINVRHFVNFNRISFVAFYPPSIQCTWNQQSALSLDGSFFAEYKKPVFIVKNQTEIEMLMEAVSLQSTSISTSLVLPIIQSSSWDKRLSMCCTNAVVHDGSRRRSSMSRATNT